MATEKPYVLPQGQQLTSETITNLYLYAQPTTPTDDELLSSDLIRPILNLQNIPDDAETISDIPQDIELVNAYVDAEPYMASGAGRFANGSQFDLVRAFFGLGKDQMLTDEGRDNLVEEVVLAPGTYTKENIDDLLFQGDEDGKGLGSFSSSIELRNYRDTLNDYDELVYIWNSSAFSIPNNAEFVVNLDRTREIRNFRIEPNAFPTLKDKENFDFATANPIVEIGSGLILEPRVDPSGIGRTVYIDFYNRGNLPIYDPVDENESAGIYNLIDFNADLARERLFYQPNFFGVIEPVKREAQHLFDSGVTKFLYQNKPIVYGSENQDVFVPIEINSITYPYQSDYKGNGYVFIGGEDIDYLPGGFNDDILLGNEGDDVITGDAPFTSLIGGNDTLSGGEGNDELDGSIGEDIAVFSDNFENYDYSISEDGKTITFSHTRGTQEDGIDTLKNIEFAQFGGNSNPDLSEPPRIIPLPLEDGIANTLSEQVYVEPPEGFAPDPVTPPYVSLTAPISMLDGDIDYTLNISPYKPDTHYNISYIFDTSGSMDESELQTAKDAYIDLINYYIDTGVAENSNFSVISFSRFANPYFNLTGSQAISIIQNLTTAPTSEGTKYNDALNQGLNFLSQSPLDLLNTSNIAYFVTDGKSQTDFFDPSDVSYHQDAQNLRRFAHVQAFGINEQPNEPGAVTSGQLNFVDSNDGVLVSDIANLSAELNKSGLAADVSEVKILVDGELVETIPANQLTDSPIGLTYEGSLDNLNVSIDAENVITAEVVFNNDLPTTTVDYTVTAGEGETTDSNGNPIDEEANPDPLERMRNGGDDDDTITLGYPDLGANGGAGGDYIVGNNRHNLLNGGAGNDTIYGHGGNDTITTGSGKDRVDGGADIDTVVYDDVVYQDNDNIFLRRVGNILSYNNTDSLTDVEFIQFADVRISTQTLEITPTIEVKEINTIEGSPASFNFELAYAAPVDIVFDYSTADGDAVAGLDYTATSGQVTIPAGETIATIEVETLEDTIYDENTETLILNLTGLRGATFANNETALGVPVYIENQQAAMTLVGDGEANFLTGGNNNDLIQGKEGNDILNGGDGDDTLVGEAGDDTLDGGAGSDRFFVFSNHNITLTDTQVTGDGTDAIALLEYAHLTGDNQSNIIDASSTTEISTLVKGNGGYDTGERKNVWS